MPEKDLDKLDGRKLRTDSSRQKIVDAFLHLLYQGNISPSAEEVAKAANVGLRTVFRRFKEMELLYREMAIAIQNRFAPEAVKPWKTKGAENQLQELLARKATIYEDLLPYLIASQYHRHRSEFIKEHNEYWIAIEQKVLESILPFDRKKEPLLFSAIEITLSIDTWLQMRISRKLDAKQCHDTMKFSLAALLSQYQG